MKKLFSLLTAVLLLAVSAKAQMHLKWGDPDNYTISCRLVDGYGHSSEFSEYVYYWENTSTSQFIMIDGHDINRISTDPYEFGNKVLFVIKVTSTRNYSDGNGGTVPGPLPGTYNVEVPGFEYYGEPDNGEYYGTFYTSASQCVVGYKSVSGYYGSGTCNLGSRFHDNNSFSVVSITGGHADVSEGKNGTMFLKYFTGSGKLCLTIGEEAVDDGVITAISNDNAKGNVTGTVVGSGAAFVSGTTYDGGTQITLNANAESGYAFLQWNDGNTDISRTITVNGNADYVATFVTARTITVGVDNAEHGTATGSGTYPDGSSVSISALGLNGYVFSHWDDGNTYNPRTITVSSSKTTYTAYFEESSSYMSIVSPCSNADIYAHFTYSNLSTSRAANFGYNRWYDWDDFNNGSYQQIYIYKITAQNSSNDKLTLFLSPSLKTSYQGGECTSLYENVPAANTYILQKPGLARSNSYDDWVVNDNTASVYKYLSNYNATSSHCDIIMQNNSNQHWDLDEGGSIIISKNNVGGIFIETDNNVTEDANGQSVYFTVGNRSENTFAPATATMNFTGSYLTMTATDNSGNNARITVKNFNTNNNSYSLNGTTDFDLDHCSLYYDGDYIEEIQSISGTIQRSVSAGIIYYTLSNVKIRTCQEDLYIINMTAPAPSYTLTWNKNAEDATLIGGTAAGAVQFTQTLTAPTATRTGYTNTWSPSVPSTMPAQDVTYTAQWSAINYSITYNQNDGTGATNGTYTIESSDITLPTASAMTKTGHTFDGWYDNSGFTGSAITTIPQGSTGNKTFWAKWTAKEYTVNLDNQSATTAGQESVTATYGQAMPSIASNLPEKTNCIFEGYYSAQIGGIKYYNADGTSAHNWDIDVNPTTLYAHWIRLYTITIADYTGGTVTVSPDGGTPFTTGSQDIAEGTNITITASNAEHYTLTSLTYSDEGAISSGAEREIDGPHTITAVFTANTYALTLDKGDGTADGGATATYNSNTLTSVSHAAKTGNWSLNGYFTETTGGTKVINADGTLVADVSGYTDEDGKWIRTEGTMTLYAQWEENITPDIKLYDNTDGSEYAGLLSTHAGKKVNVILKDRTFASNRWHTLSLPFDFDFEDHLLDGRVYTLNDCTVDNTNGMVITFRSVSEVVAGQPYLVWIDAAMSDVRFEDVTLTTFTPGEITAPSGDVKFIASIPKIVLTDKKFIFINNNRLYYPKQDGGSTMRAFRAYFEILNAHDMVYTPQRIRIVAQDNYGNTMEVMELDEERTEETRKYIEDGILIIERGGVRYDAQGKKLD